MGGADADAQALNSSSDWRCAPPGEPRGSAAIPNNYPLMRDVEWYIADEQRLGRLLDYAVIAPRLQRLYEWSAEEICEPHLRGLVRDGSPIYAWPYEQRHVWRAQHLPFPGGPRT